MINSINFIDGLDGLSSGVAFIAVVTLGIISVTGPATEPLVALICFTLAGALLGFLRWNFHPASIFIGTSGVMFLGYTLALLSIRGSAKVAVALLVLGVPIIDTFYIIVRRLSRGRSPFSADRGHIHHRLLDLGLSHTQTVLLIYAICAGLGALSLVLSGSGQLYAFLGAFLAFGLVILLLDRAVEDRDRTRRCPARLDRATLAGPTERALPGEGAGVAKPVGEEGARDAVLALLGAPGLRTWLAIVASVVATGTAGYMVLEGWSSPRRPLHDGDQRHHRRVQGSPRT